METKGITINTNTSFFNIRNDSITRRRQLKSIQRIYNFRIDVNFVVNCYVTSIPQFHT